MFDGSATDGHGFGQQIEPLLHGLEHSFIRPPPYALRLFGCAARSQLARMAGGEIAIFVFLSAMVRAYRGSRELRACRAGIMIVIRIIDIVGLREEAALRFA